MTELIVSLLFGAACAAAGYWVGRAKEAKGLLDEALRKAEKEKSAIEALRKHLPEEK